MRRYDVLEQPDGAYTAIGAGTSYSWAGFRWAWHNKPYFIPMLIIVFAVAAAILFLFTAFRPAVAIGLGGDENRALGIILAVTFLVFVFVYLQSTVNTWRKKDFLNNGWEVVAARVAADNPDAAIAAARPRIVYDDPIIHKALDLRDAGQIDEARSIFARLIDEGHADKRVIGFAKRQLMILEHATAKP